MFFVAAVVAKEEGSRSSRRRLAIAEEHRPHRTSVRIHWPLMEVLYGIGWL